MCVRCKTREARRGALCDGCRMELEIRTEIERNTANAQMQAEAQAKPKAKARRVRREWVEAV